MVTVFDIGTDLILVGGVIVLAVLVFVIVTGVFLCSVCKGLNSGLVGKGFAVIELMVENVAGLMFVGVDDEEALTAESLLVLLLLPELLPNDNFRIPFFKFFNRFKGLVFSVGVDEVFDEDEIV